MSKKNLLLGGFLAILLLLAYVYNGPYKNWQNDSSGPKNFLATYNEDDLNKIEVSHNDKKYVFIKMGDKWKIDGTKDFFLTKLKTDKIKQVLDDVRKSDLTLVSELQDKKKEFNTDEDNGYLVNLQNNDITLASLIIGKSGDGFSSTYISQPNIDNTYLVKSDLHGAFTNDDWYDKQIFNFDKTKVDKIRFQYPSREFTVIRDLKSDNKKWTGTLPYKFSVNQDKLDKIINILAKLMAVNIPEQTFANTGLEKNKIIIQVSGEEIDNTIMIGDDNGQGEYYAKRGDSDNIYLISEADKKELEKRISQLR